MHRRGTDAFLHISATDTVGGRTDIMYTSKSKHQELAIYKHISFILQLLKVFQSHCV